MTTLINQNFSEELELKIKNLDDLIEFNNIVINKINAYIIKENNLEWKSEKFIEAFEQWLLSKFPNEKIDNEERKELMWLLERKNSLRQELLIENIKRWNVNLSQDIIDSIKYIAESWITEWLNGSYKLVEKQIKLFWENPSFWESINYWIPRENNHIFWYPQIVDWININSEILDKIQDENIKKYLLWMVRLINEWNYSYKDWINNELHEVNSWLSNSPIAIVWLMENYLDKNFIDPEIVVMMREKSPKSSWEFWDLSIRIYWNDYWMSSVHLDFAEPLILWWDITYNKFLWKSFPNDENLRSEFGNFIIILKWWISNSFDEYCKSITKVFDISQEELIKDKQEIIDWTIEEVTYHEYWHSIFWVQMQNEIEEAKATLFYWVYLYEKYIINWEEISKEEIDGIIKSFTLDFSRYLTRLEIPKYRKYLYTAQILFQHMTDRNILKYNESKNIIEFVDDDNLVENFREMLVDIKWTMDNIKDIYEKKDTQAEKAFLEYYNSANFEILKKLYGNF